MKTKHENTRDNASQSEEEDKKLMNSQQFENSDENPPNHENGNMENEKVDHLIQIAKESTKSKEQDKQNNDENPLSFNTLQRPKVNPEYQRRHLNTPWYTNPEEGLGSADMRRYNSRLVKSIPNSVQEVSKSKSTTQQDFPKYSSQELEECRQIKRYHGNRESVDWTFNEADDSGNQEDKLRRSRYHRSSAVIGEGFMDKFGLKSPLNNKRTTESHEVLENGNSDYMKTKHENTRDNASQSEEEDKKLMNSQQFENSDENPPNHENGNMENEKVDHLIQIAKESTKSKEQDKQNNDENPLSFNTLQRPKVNPEYQRRHLNTPWYTNPEEGLGSADMRRYNSRLVKSIPNSVQEVSKSKSTTQQDFPKYSSQELEECRQIKRYHGNRESVDWTFNEADDSGNQEDKLRRSRYHRSSAVIGEGFMDKFGLKSPLNNKRTNDTPVAASTLRNSPYAFHVQMD
ncbi:unnamed protein product [Schistosoma turkestanicum]|nr:unnamed protein product [Schistosoma turkestanicum]